MGYVGATIAVSRASHRSRGASATIVGAGMATRRDDLVAQLKELGPAEVAEAVRDLQAHLDQELDEDPTAAQQDELARAFDDAREGRNMVDVDDVDSFLAELSPGS